MRLSRRAVRDGLCAVPLTFDGGPPDYSWFAVVALDVLVLGPVAIMFGYLVDMLIVLPIWSLTAQSAAGVRNTGTAPYRVYFPLLMLGIVALAILVAAGSTITALGRSIVSLGLALAGVASTDGAGSPVLWAARGTFVLLIALGVGINREYRRLRAGR